MFNKYIFSSALILLMQTFFLNQSTSQISFSNANNRLHSVEGEPNSNQGIRSGNALCVIDVDNNGLDDIVKLTGNRYLHIEYQQPGGTFTYQYIGDFGSSNCWGIAAADVDNNGFKDILFNGGSQARLMKLNNTGTGILGNVINLPNGNIFCQNGNFCDVNNDGWSDIFMCNDVGENRLWVNDGTGNFPAEQGNSPHINFNVTPGMGVVQSISGHTHDESGNYASIWTDFDNDGDVDLYIVHCRQGTSAGDLRRTNVLFVNNGDGTYTSRAEEYGLESNDQDWTGSFADIDNDGDFDLFMTKHNVISRYYINDGAGNYTISPNPISFGNMPQHSYFEDFDNDGFVDLMITGSGQQRLFRNNGDATFTQVSNDALGFGNSTMISFTIGDLNHDGKIDLYTSYGSTYNNPSGSTDDVLWLNTTNNSNNFITFLLTGTSSNINALGAKALIYGDWGVQIREVRSGESYGTASSLQLHFGIGEATNVDSALIKWPDGTITQLYDLSPNQFVCIVQGQMPLTDVTIATSGSNLICDGQTVSLSAPEGVNYTYLWSNGDTTQTIEVGAGSYNVTVSNGGACAANSPAITIIENPAENPTIVALDNLLVCEGTSVVVQASGSDAFAWSNGETGETIEIVTAGDYWVTVQGLCQTWNSDTLTLVTLSNAAPTGEDVFLAAPGTAQLNVTGENVTWYASETGGEILASGNTFTTPFVNATTSFYAENETIHQGAFGNIPAPNIEVATLSSNTLNGFLLFDVLATCRLNAVQVSTTVAGQRIIELRNNAGQVINSLEVNLEAGLTTINLNFELNPGINYQLGTNTANNNAQFGFNAPALVRTQNGAAFPFEFPGFVSIKSGNNGSINTPNTYYYFYNWEVEELPVSCNSVRTPFTVNVSTVSVESIFNDTNISIYPNPTSELLNVHFYLNSSSNVDINVSDLTGRNVRRFNLGQRQGDVYQTIETQQLAKGVYNLILTNNNIRYTKLFIVN